MKKTISIITEEFENEQTGKKVEGITVMVDGMLKEFINIIQSKDSKYKSSTDVIQDALMKGLGEIKRNVS